MRIATMKMNVVNFGRNEVNAIGTKVTCMSGVKLHVEFVSLISVRTLVRFFYLFAPFQKKILIKFLTFQNQLSFC